MATKKTEEKDFFELLQNLLKNWPIVLPCVLFAAAVGVFAAMWIRPVYQVDALLQIETKNAKGPSMMGIWRLFLLRLVLQKRKLN